MFMKIKTMADNKYIVNGMVILAHNYKAAIAQYLEVHGGSYPIFASK